MNLGLPSSPRLHPRRTRTFSLLSRKSDCRDPGSNPDDVFGEAKTCPVIAYGSIQFLRLPWVTLDQDRARRLRQRTFQVERVARSGGPLLTYRMSGGKLGLPGPFEGSVFHALEALTIEESRLAGGEIKNPIIFSLRQVCERLCLKEVVPWFKAVERAIRLLSEVRIDGPEGEDLCPAWGSRIRLVEPLLFRTRLGDREAASFRHVIQLDSGHVAAMNRGVIRGMNWAVWVALRNPVARRLLEFLDPLPEGQPVGVPLGVLMRHLPVGGTSSLARMKEALSPAHAELVGERYLERVDWISPGPEMQVRYYPGPSWRALAARLRARDARMTFLPAPTTVFGRAGLG